MPEEPKKKSIFKGLGNLIFEKDESSSDQGKPEGQQSSNAEPAPSNAEPPAEKTTVVAHRRGTTATRIAAAAAAPDDTFYLDLKQDIDDASAQAYKIFMAKFNALKDLGMDRTQQIRAAYKTSGLTKKDLVAALDGRRALLQKEQYSFETALESQTREQIATKQSEVAQLAESIKEEEAELERIIQETQERIQTMKSQKESAELVVASSLERQEKAKVQFKAAHERLSQEIDSETQEVSNLI